MAVVVGKGSFRGFAESVKATDNNKEECSTEQCISNNLQTISRNVQQLKKMVESLGTSMDSRELRNKMGTIQAETNQLTKDTNMTIKQFADTPPEDESQLKEWKIQHRRFKETFHDILKDYNDQQKIIRIKDRDSIRNSLMKSGCFDIDIDETGAFVKDGEQIQAEAIQAEVDLDLIKEREQALKQLELDISDINDIFKDLAGMVQEQGEILAEIEVNVETAALEVEIAVEELKVAKENVESSRRKTLICIIIVTIVLVIVAIAVVIAVVA